MGFAGSLAAAGEKLPWFPVEDSDARIVYVIKRRGASNARAALRMFPAELLLPDGRTATKTSTSGTPTELGIHQPSYIMTIVYAKGAKVKPGVLLRRKGADVTQPAPAIVEAPAPAFVPETSIQRRSNMVTPDQREAFYAERASMFPAPDGATREFNNEQLVRALQTHAGRFEPNLLNAQAWAYTPSAMATLPVKVEMRVHGARDGVQVHDAIAALRLFKHRHELTGTVKVGSATFFTRVNTGSLRALLATAWENNQQEPIRFAVQLTRGKDVINAVMVLDDAAQTAFRGWLGKMQNEQFGKLP